MAHFAQIDDNNVVIQVVVINSNELFKLVKKLIITDSIDNSSKIKNNNKIEVLSITSLMSEAIKRIANSNSVSDLFN